MANGIIKRNGVTLIGYAEGLTLVVIEQSNEMLVNRASDGLKKVDSGEIRKKG